MLYRIYRQTGRHTDEQTYGEAKVKPHTHVRQMSEYQEGKKDRFYRCVAQTYGPAQGSKYPQHYSTAIKKNKTKIFNSSESEVIS